jgi:SAM-dependent methyltransferase
MSRSIRAAAVLAACFSVHAASVRAQGEEVPFITTPDNVTAAMLSIAQVGPKDYVIDLGSGDGRIVIVAAKQFGARGLGVEIVPDLVKQSVQNAARAGVADRAEFREQDLFNTDLAKATVVTLYLLPEVNLQLRPRILALKPGTRVVSHDWDMADWMPDRTVVLDVPDKKIGLEKKSKVHLWIVPARIEGAWCGSGKLRGATLQVDRKFQQFHATVTRGAAVQAFDGRIEGPLAKSVDGDLALDADAEHLRARVAQGPFAGMRGADFTRLRTERCR